MRKERSVSLFKSLEEDRLAGAYAEGESREPARSLTRSKEQVKYGAPELKSFVCVCVAHR